MTASELERLAVLETKVDSIEGKLDGLKADLCAFIESADDRYASKLTERLVYGAAGMALVAVMGALIALVVVR